MKHNHIWQHVRNTALAIMEKQEDGTYRRAKTVLFTGWVCVCGKCHTNKPKTGDFI